jgi:alpha-N-acetylglucosaminidase
LPQIAANLGDVLASPDKGKLAGIGMMMEGLGTNPIVPDFVMDMTWRTDVPPVDHWTQEYVQRRYGFPDSHATSAWRLLLATAYRSSAQTGTFLAERPSFYRQGTAYRSEPNPPYDGRELAAALDSLLAASSTLGASDAYRYDVVNLARQVLGQLGLPLVNAVEAAYTRRDRAGLVDAESRVTALLQDLDSLVGTREEFLLGRWLEDAKRWAATDAERSLYEWNARNIVTLWGTKCTEGQNDDLNLYAFKEWQGMFGSYFLPRWQEFFKRLNRSLDEGTVFDRAPFAADMCRWEQAWSRRRDSYPSKPHGDELAVTGRLIAKYREAGLL